MAADQLNKCSKVSNVTHHTSWELQKTKKAKFSHYELNTRSSISLEWDDKKNHVVPKKEQISIARRELAPFLPCVPHHQNVLGDVFAAPSELFELNDLTGLLSYEVWQTQLSVQEREFLTQFLPEGADPHTVVDDLLSGSNFCFGSPFQKWGTSVCSGDCHPDAVLRQEQCNKANKIAYYKELQEYHSKMIGSLQLWKETWACCVNPENDFSQQIPRPMNEYDKNGSSHQKDIHGSPKDDVGATSDSGYFDAEDKSYSSNSPDVAIMNGETSTRVSKTESGNNYFDSSVGLKSVARSRKGDKSRRLSVECGDGAKYMSYIKVSKVQHERVKSSMKHSNNGIQRRSLSHVLGNLDSFCVIPYEVFEEEERLKLHEHWSHLAKNDLPAGFANWNSWRSARWQLGISLRKEMEDKVKLNDQPVSNFCNQDEELKYGDVQDNMQQNGDAVLHSEANLNAENHVTATEAEPSDQPNQCSRQNQHLPQINVIHNDSQHFCSMPMDAANDDVLIQSSSFPSSLGEYPVSINRADASVGEQIWPEVSLPQSVYYQHPTSLSVNDGFVSVGELSLGQSSQPIVLESEILQKDPLRSFMHKGSDGGDSFFNPYANQDRSELLLQSLYKDPGNSHYFHEQKLSSLSFHPTVSDPMLGTNQFPRNLCPSMPMDPVLPTIQENLYSIPRQEHLLPMNNVHDWPGNGGINLPMTSSSHHRLNQNWYHADEVVHNGWSGSVVPNQDLLNGGQVVDESLFSVLAQHNGAHIGSTGAMQQFIPSGNYLGVGVGVGLGSVAPAFTAVPPRTGTGSGFNYMSGNEAQLGWMNLPHALQGTGKSFPRLWYDKDIGR
ncbi:hypothetical protein CTI12_AA000160 [Artemisia annua]|uniref:DEUBAD domain-containing protein n=1 Tax=Artemisia annua TaxID=35608 RepID=A0A2U1QJK0_ARTAN|nr:hypothetical protein CTI12_AA000160 [Artemisia annua]